MAQERGNRFSHDNKNTELVIRGDWGGNIRQSSDGSDWYDWYWYLDALKLLVSLDITF